MADSESALGNWTAARRESQWLNALLKNVCSFGCRFGEKCLMTSSQPKTILQSLRVGHHRCAMHRSTISVLLLSQRAGTHSDSFAQRGANRFPRTLLVASHVVPNQYNFLFSSGFEELHHHLYLSLSRYQFFIIAYYLAL